MERRRARKAADRSPTSRGCNMWAQHRNYATWPRGDSPWARCLWTGHLQWQYLPVGATGYGQATCRPGGHMQMWRPPMVWVATSTCSRGSVAHRGCCLPRKATSHANTMATYDRGGAVLVIARGSQQPQRAVVTCGKGN
ncbi:hypothetical protein GW17_00032638 [Ensete ventricosum]|uniref:Uncharacterized protein n=1 Tax=Ensete ventricosum TaxID=4639 RepID=A0A444E1D4_ENSVE|nr:hypothetical protein GW17_00032638 [Ensete ventricosum]RZR73240.1 hypothetical protein BHM03_00021789 [Ensete ventricosum]